MKFENLDKIFQNFVKEIVVKNPQKYADHDKLEDDLGLIFESFCNTKIASLDKLTPREYAQQLVVSNEIEDYVDYCLNNNIEISDIISDELIKYKNAVEFLSGYLYDTNMDAKMYAVNVLAEIGGDEVCDIFIKLLTNPDVPEKVKLVAYEYMCDGERTIPLKILNVINSVPLDQQGILVEILSNYKGISDVYYWLITMLQRAEDVPLYAGLLGSYGDAGAIDILKSFAKENDINYIEYVEIRNAVEQLGGEMDIEKDFTDDPYYKYMHKEYTEDDKN